MGGVFCLRLRGAAGYRGPCGEVPGGWGTSGLLTDRRSVGEAGLALGDEIALASGGIGLEHGSATVR